MRGHRLCTNCGAFNYWGRWCRDCVRMAAKAAVVEFLAGGAVYLIHWWTSL